MLIMLNVTISHSQLNVDTLKSLSLIPYTKINSHWIKDLKERPHTIKPLEESIGRTLFDLNFSKILFDPPPRAMKIKIKINK